MTSRKNALEALEILGACLGAHGQLPQSRRDLIDTIRVALTDEPNRRAFHASEISDEDLEIIKNTQVPEEYKYLDDLLGDAVTREDTGELATGETSPTSMPEEIDAAYEDGYQQGCKDTVKYDTRIKQQEWLPIESAPRDGTIIIVTYPHQGHVMQFVSYNKFHKYWQSRGEPQLGLENQECLWTHTPPPPKKESEDD